MTEKHLSQRPTEALFRDTVSQFPSGVTVVTTCAEQDGVQEDIGLTVSAFSSLSLDPPMVVVSVDKNSRSHDYLAVGAPIGISILAQDQRDIAIQFARHGVDRFHGVAIERRIHNLPLIAQASAWFAGSVEHRFEAGDHIIITVDVQECGYPGYLGYFDLGRTVDGESKRESDVEKKRLQARLSRTPLLYHRGVLYTKGIAGE